jgi:hypothetical protein
VEQPNIAERFQKAIEETKGIRRRSPLFYLLLLLVLLVVGHDAYVTFQKVPGLQEENVRLRGAWTELEKTTVKVSETAKQQESDLLELRALLTPIQATAQRRYPDAQGQALARLQEDLDKQEAELVNPEEVKDKQHEDIKKLQRTNSEQEKQISGLKRRIAELEKESAERKVEPERLKDPERYSEMAMWTMDGRIKLPDGQFVETPVAGWSDTYRREKPGEPVRWRCGSVALFHYREVIEKYPEFPFPFCVLAQCLKAKGEPSWQEYARKGLSVLEKTVKISGHVSDHDEALAELQVLLDTP